MLECCIKKWITVVKVTVNVECLDDIFWTTEPFITKRSIVVHHHELDWKDWYAVFMVTAEASYCQMMAFFCVCEMLILLQPNLVWCHKLDCLLTRLNCSVVSKVTVTAKIQHFSECSSGWYHLNSWTFCNQTWHGKAEWWARALCEKIFCYFQVEGQNEG